MNINLPSSFTYCTMYGLILSFEQCDTQAYQEYYGLKNILQLDFKCLITTYHFKGKGSVTKTILPVSLQGCKDDGDMIVDVNNKNLMVSDDYNFIINRLVKFEFTIIPQCTDKGSIKLFTNSMIVYKDLKEMYDNASQKEIDFMNSLRDDGYRSFIMADSKVDQLTETKTL